MALMGPAVLSLLIMVAGCWCAPANLLDIGGTVGYNSHINGTIGGHLKATRDGLSVSGTGRGIIGASWTPELIASGHAGIGDKIIAGDASLKTVIDNSWQPGFQGELGRNSKGEWLAGFQPDSQLYNKFLLTPNVQVMTGDDARKLVGIPIAAPVEPYNRFEGAPQYMMNPAYYNPYGYMPAVDPKMYAGYLAYVQALSQSQAMPSPVKAQQ